MASRSSAVARLRMPALDDDLQPSAEPDQRGRRRGPGPTIWPATIVIGIALVVLVAGGLAAVFSTGGTTTGSAALALKAAPGAPMAARRGDR